MAIYSGFTHKKWWFSIVMLVYQRVSTWMIGVKGLDTSNGKKRQDRDALPDKYFVEGEPVVILHHLRGQQTGTVANPHVNWCLSWSWPPIFFLFFGGLGEVLGGSGWFLILWSANRELLVGRNFHLSWRQRVSSKSWKTLTVSKNDHPVDSWSKYPTKYKMSTSEVPRKS